MNKVIDPKTVERLSQRQAETSQSQASEETKFLTKQSGWQRLKSWIFDVCETFKPVVSLIGQLLSIAVCVKQFVGNSARKSREYAVC
jgi:hypothetical protein